ncbi:hypothetical protein [Streptomyces ossamyceticus]|uniref:MmyB family transcriptional regulator n=1 Tax=Streptomyces ossamyceticus TaxID=249581 RepID=UPI000AFC6665|nr:hypothetical protein [Streptomyces ossamyceticus]
MGGTSSTSLPGATRRPWSACPPAPTAFFLGPGSRHFFVGWEDGATAAAAPLRAEAGRDPYGRSLREPVGELSTPRPDFRAIRAAHDVRISHEGVKRLRRPEGAWSWRIAPWPFPSRRASSTT